MDLTRRIDIDPHVILGAGNPQRALDAVAES